MCLPLPCIEPCCAKSPSDAGYLPHAGVAEARRMPFAVLIPFLVARLRLLCLYSGNTVAVRGALQGVLHRWGLIANFAAMGMERIYDDPQVGRVVFRKKIGVRRVSIRVNAARGVAVSMPFMVPYDEAMRFYLAKREWVLETLRRQKETAPAKELTAEELAELRKQAGRYLPARLSYLAGVYGFAYSSLRLKHNRTNWGSCSSKNNINLNISLMTLPPLLRDYVMLHELCHLRHHDHSRAFHLLLEHLLTDHLVKCLDDSGAQPDNCRGEAEGLSADADSLEFARQIARKAASSKSEFPIDRTFSSLIRTYRP